MFIASGVLTQTESTRKEGTQCELLLHLYCEAARYIRRLGLVHLLLHIFPSGYSNSYDLTILDLEGKYFFFLLFKFLFFFSFFFIFLFFYFFFTRFGSMKAFLRVLDQKEQTFFFKNFSKIRFTKEKSSDEEKRFRFGSSIRKRLELLLIYDRRRRKK